MKLVHPDFFFPIELSEIEIPVLILEDPSCFRKFVWEIRKQVAGGEGQWVFSENNKPLKMAKTCELILDPFALDVNQRKILTSLYDRVEKNVSCSELLLSWNKAESYFQNMTEELLSTVDEFPLIYRNDISIKEFLKFIDVRFEESTKDILEYMIDYMRMSSEVAGTRLFVLCNLKPFFDSQELGYLYEQALYHKFCLLLVEGYVPDRKEEREKWWIVDKDNCVIMPTDV